MTAYRFNRGTTAIGLVSMANEYLKDSFQENWDQMIVVLSVESARPENEPADYTALNKRVQALNIQLPSVTKNFTAFNYDLGFDLSFDLAKRFIYNMNVGTQLTDVKVLYEKYDRMRIAFQAVSRDYVVHNTSRKYKHGKVEKLGDAADHYRSTRELRKMSEIQLRGGVWPWWASLGEIFVDVSGTNTSFPVFLRASSNKVYVIDPDNEFPKGKLPYELK